MFLDSFPMSAGILDPNPSIADNFLRSQENFQQTPSGQPKAALPLTPPPSTSAKWVI